MHRRGDEGRRVVFDVPVDARGKAPRQLGHPGPDLSIDLQCVRSGRLIDRDEDGRLLVEPRARRVLQGAKLDTGDITQPYNGFARRPGADDDVAELLWIAEPADRIELELERRVRWCGGLSQSASGHLDILLCDRILDVHRRDAEGGELVRIEPHAHRVAPLAEDAHVADTRKPLQRVDELQIGVVAEGDEIDRSVRRSEVDPQQDIGVLLGNDDAGLVDNRRQLRRRLGDAVLHIDRSNVDRIADIESDGDVRAAVIGADRRHVGHARHAVDLLLERGRHGVGDDLGTGARVGCGDNHLRWRDIGKLRDWQQVVRDEPGQYHDDGDD